MNSVELALAMADYTDYYIASAETEPGFGQYYGPRAERDGKQYKGWLDELGDPKKDKTYNGEDGTYKLGKVIVDDFYNFYEQYNLYLKSQNLIDYDDMLSKIDAVYIVSHPGKHYIQIKKALQQNKHVICESPVTLDPEQTEELFQLAKEKECVLMEGIKTAPGQG